MYDCLKVNFLILASFPEWNASACMISMPLLWENPPEWPAQGFTLINPQLDCSGSWCSNTRHVCSQISSWRVAAGWGSPALFFFFFPASELKECSWLRKPKWSGEGLFLTLIDTRYLEMSLTPCSCCACWHGAKADYSEPTLSIFSPWSGWFIITGYVSIYQASISSVL